MSEIHSVTGTGIPLLVDEIDTDRIIPARFLRCVTFDGLGEHAFEDDRRQDPNHPFDAERYANASILVAGRNFGCGSSREHAPQSLMRWGIRAVVAESFAEIFFGNCTSLGIPCVTAERSDLERLVELVEADPTAEITVCLAENRVTLADHTADVAIPDGARSALRTGKYDFLGQLLDGADATAETAASLPYVSQFAE